MPTVNGVTTTPDQWGQILGTANGDRIAGGSGNDTLKGTGGNDSYYGGDGSDTFIITQGSLAASTPTTNGIKAEAVIYDFSNAGVAWSSSNSDFIAFTGFGTAAQGTTLTFDHYGDAAGTTTVDPTLQYYTIHDGLNNTDYHIFVHSVNGQQLVLGDYNFY
jgi:Ca2+-binding RTX toxin-like protein